GAECAQHAGQFHADVAGADDGHVARTRAQREEAVGGDAELATWHRLAPRPSAGRDRAVRCIGLASVRAHARAAEQFAATGNDFDAEFLEAAARARMDVRDVALAPLDEGAPVQRAGSDIETDRARD